MPHADVDNWFDRIMLHAKANYGSYGWDNFVECVDRADFKATCTRLNLDTYEKAYTEFREWCELKRDMEEEVRGWAF